MWARSGGAAAALVAVSVGALVAWSFWQRWQLVTASPFPLGVDGYFYPVQLRALLEHGELRYPAAPLAFYLLAPFAAVTDPITGAKLGASLLGAASAAPAYGVGARLGASRGAGLVAAALATTSVGSAYLTIEFVKNGIGLTVALTALWLALRAGERPSRARVAAAIAGLAAAYATHKMAAALALAVAIPAALGDAASRGALRGRRLIYAIAGLALVAALALAIGALAPRRVLSAGDAALLGGLFSATPHWSAPALVFPTGELGLGHDALLGLVLALVAIVGRCVLGPPDRAGAPHASAPRASAPHPAATWPILALALAIGLPFLDVTDRQGLGFRLRIAAFVPAALAAAIAIRMAFAPLVVRVTAALPGPAWRALPRDLVLALLALVLAVVRQPGARLDGEVVTHPALVTAAQALAGRIPAGAIVIVPERQIAFMVAWYTGAAVAIRPEGVPAEQRLRLLPLNFIEANSPLDRQLMAARAEPSLVPPLGVHPLHPNGLVLVAEPTWRWILAHLPPADRLRYAAWPTI
jgi:hypothetical protein